MSERADRVIKIEAETWIPVKPEDVFAAFTTDLDAWWPHRTRDHAVIVYEPHVGGRVFEDWGDGTGLLYGNVGLYDPPHRHVLIRPGLNAEPYTTQSVEELEPDGEGTRYHKTLILWGDVREEIEKMYRQGVPSVTEALKTYVEKHPVSAG